MPEPTDRQILHQAISRAYDATKHVALTVDGRQLYADAARAALARIPGPIGEAVAGVLAAQAEHSRRVGYLGIVGERCTTIALALAVLELLPAEVPGG